jgi:hypothetical protein
MLVGISFAAADSAYMTFTNKSFGVASGTSAPYFYGYAINNTSTYFFVGGGGAQRATIAALNAIPIGTQVHVTYENFVITSIT